jgi:hypothetical protein
MEDLILTLQAGLSKDFTATVAQNAKALPEIEKKIIDERVAFTTWIVGIASASFLAVLTQMHELAPKLAADARQDLIAPSIMFGATLILSVSYRLFVPKLLSSIQVEQFSHDVQLSHVQFSPGIFLTDFKTMRFVDLQVQLMERKYLPTDVLDRVRVEQLKESGVRRAAEGIYGAALVGFFLELAAIAFVFAKAYL